MNDPFEQLPPTATFALNSAGLARLGRLVRKELTEILRDRRTILTLVLMPLLLYPLLTVAFQQYFLAAQPTLEYLIGFEDKLDEQFFTSIVHEGQTALAEQTKAKDQKAAERMKLATPEPVIKSGVFKDLEKAIRDKAVDVGVRLKNLSAVSQGKTGLLDAEASYLPESPSAAATLSHINRCLAARNLAILETRFAARPTAPGLPILKLKRVALESTAAGDGTVSLAALVPFILILMTITGAVYPAIDLTAGERERGTLEILVAAPVPRLGLLFAKYVAVLTVSIMTALINLTAMFVTLKTSGWGQMVFGKHGLPFSSVLALLGLLILFAAFFSAVLLILTSFARSFKEAQAYLIPLMLASLGPGLAGILPGLTLRGALAVTPLVNIVLLARDIFEDKAEPVAILLVTLSTLLYAAVAITLAAKIFGAEEVLYSEQSSWTDLWRRPRHTQPTASASAALICLALMVPCNFVLLAILRGAELPAMGLVLGQVPIYVALFVLLPGFAAVWRRVELPSGFGLSIPTWLTLAGALVLGLTLWPIVIQLMKFFHSEYSDLIRERVEAGASMSRQVGWIFSVNLGVAAVTEELFFRGYLFSALARAMKPAGVIVLTAVLFGVMHGLLAGGLAFEQVLPATLMGLVLGTIRWRSGSVFPGLALHLAHNLVLSIVLLNFANSWQDTVPAAWLLVGALGAPMGAALVYLGGRKDRT